MLYRKLHRIVLMEANRCSKHVCAKGIKCFLFFFFFFFTKKKKCVFMLNETEKWSLKEFPQLWHLFRFDKTSNLLNSEGFKPFTGLNSDGI